MRSFRASLNPHELSRGLVLCARADALFERHLAWRPTPCDLVKDLPERTELSKRDLQYLAEHVWRVRLARFLASFRQATTSRSPQLMAALERYLDGVERDWALGSAPSLWLPECDSSEVLPP